LLLLRQQVEMLRIPAPVGSKHRRAGRKVRIQGQVGLRKVQNVLNPGHLMPVSLCTKCERPLSGAMCRGPVLAAVEGRSPQLRVPHPTLCTLCPSTHMV
jgi:hypothetical protein